MSQDTIYGADPFNLAVQPIANRTLAQQNGLHPSQGATLDLTATQRVLVPDATTGKQAVNYDTMVAYGGGGSNQPLNAINAAHPLTANLDFSGSTYHVRASNPAVALDVANKYYVDTAVSGIVVNKIAANGDLTTQRQIYQTGETLFFQNQPIQVINAQKQTSSIPIAYTSELQIIDQYQLPTVGQVSALIAEETKRAEDAEGTLQDNIDALAARRLDQIPIAQDTVILGNQRIQNMLSGITGPIIDDTTNAATVGDLRNMVNGALVTAQGYATTAEQHAKDYTDDQIEALALVYRPLDSTVQDIINDSEPSQTPLDVVGTYPGILANDLNLASATNNQWLTTRNTVENQISARYINSLQPPNANISMANHRLTNLQPGQDATDAVTVLQMQQSGITLDQVKALHLNEFQAPTTAVSMDSKQITNVASCGTVGYLNTNAVNGADLYSYASTIKDQIQSSNQSAQVIANYDGSIAMRANGQSDTLVVTADPTFGYKLDSGAKPLRLASDSSYVDINTGALQIANGSSGQVSIGGRLFTGGSDSGSTQQVLNRGQNDVLYAPVDVPISNLGPALDVVDVSGSNTGPFFRMINVASPVGTNDVAIKSYVDDGLGTEIQNRINGDIQATANADAYTNSRLTSYSTTAQANNLYMAKTTPLNEIPLATGSVSANQNRVVSLADGLFDQDAVNVRQLAGAMGGYLPTSTTLNEIQTPTAPVLFGGQLLRNLQTPLLDADASTKAYADGAISTALTSYSTTLQIADTYLTQANAASTYQRKDQVYSQIVSSDVTNGVICATGATGILLNANLAGTSTRVAAIVAPSGQPSGSMQLTSPGKILLVANSSATSLYSGSGQTSNSVYIGSSSDSTDACYDQLVIGNGRSTAPQLTLSSGHSAIAVGQIPYSIICNSNDLGANIGMNLQLSPEVAANVLSGCALNLYSTSVSAIPIKAQFTKPTGYSFVQSSALSEEFITKHYADVNYGPGSITQISSSGNATVSVSSSGIDLTVNAASATPIRINKASSTSQWQIQPAVSSNGLLIGSNFSGVQILPSTTVSSLTASSSLRVTGALDLVDSTSISCGSQSIGFAGGTINGLPSCGVVSSANGQPVIASDMFSYVANTGANTSQTYTITLQGSTTTGITWANIPANTSSSYCQIQKVKGGSTALITSSTVQCQSATLASSWAQFSLTMSSNVRITQVWAYSTTAAGLGSQQNIASLTYCQQASSTAGQSNLQLYKPASAQGSDPFILYLTVDGF